MTVATPVVPTTKETASTSVRQLLHEIAARTNREIHELQVVRRGSHIVVSGVCKSYYTKQLATQAIQEGVPEAVLENEILVAHELR